MRPIVVKLGGSLAAAGTLRHWLTIINEFGRGRAIIVSGGGVFADAVRAAQREHGFSDRTAHRMALLAMEQYALLLLDLAPGLRAGEDETALRAALAAGEVALWRPTPLVLADPAIAESWSVTSDSLAAWLARRLRAERLVLVKSAPAPRPLPSPGELAAQGLVDAAFPAYAEGAEFALSWCGPGEERQLAALLQLG